MTEIGTCKECVFWDEYDHQKWGDCLNKNWRQGYYIRFDMLKPNQVLVENDEGWGFNTGPDFGCIHFKNKTDETR